MKKHLFTSLAGSGLFFLILAGAQAAPQQYNDQDRWHQDRDTYYHREGWKAHVFDRVREDLDHVQASAFSGAEDHKIAMTKRELGELQGKLASGQYDQPELDRTIEGLRAIMADNRLSPRDRDMLSDDLNRLRDYREHHDGWR